MDKGAMIQRLARLFEEGRVVIPSRIPVELLRWRPPESDASLALRFALGDGFKPWCEMLGTGLRQLGESPGALQGS